MTDVPGAAQFRASGEAYDRFMGRYARELAPRFADFAGIAPGMRVLDVGCGPGALTGEAVSRVGVENVVAIDPSPPFVEACRQRYPGVDVLIGRAEALPVPDDAFDVAASQLVWHFVSDPDAVAAEMSRAVRPGGTVASCVWEFDQGMEMLRAFWDAALQVDPDAPDEARTLRFGRSGEVAAVMAQAGLTRIDEQQLEVESRYGGFDELWDSLMLGIGPAGGHLVSLPAEQQQELRGHLERRLGSPTGGFSLRGVAIAARGVVPGAS